MTRLALFLIVLISTPGSLLAGPMAPDDPIAPPPPAPSPPAPPALRPPAPPAPPWFSADFRRGDERTIFGHLPKATEAGARDEARQQVGRSVREWLHQAGIARSWNPPEPLIDAMIRETHVERVEKDYGTMYVAADRVDFSNARGARFAELYQREVVGRRLAVLTGALGFVLISLAGLAGYIRADEATKGYYTNNLRLVAAAVVGASGVVIYRMLA